MKQRQMQRGLAALAAGLLLAGGAQAQADGATGLDAATSGIQAPHYGDVLFHHYQDHSFGALTGLMVSQHFRRLGPHDAEAELLRGGLLLAYGLHGEASTVLARLIDSQAPAAVRDRAWYHLALARQQRGLLDDAEAALAQIRAPLPGTLQIERQLLAAQLRMARGDYSAAAALLQGVQGDSKPARYARYNLAVALVQQDDAALRSRGLALLDELGQLPADDAEQRGLRDRANLARGYAALQAEQPRTARAVLQRVRLQGVHSNKALLGYGWAAMGLNDPAQALLAWQELAQRPEGDAAVLEARLAVPYAQGELRAFATALQGYQQAAAAYEQDQRTLQSAITTLRDGRVFDQLLRRAGRSSEDDALQDSTLGGFDGLRQLPDLPHAALLLPLLASHPMHEGLKNLNDLQFAGRNAQQWLLSLSSFEDMLDNRRIAFTEKLPPVLARRGAAAIAELDRQRAALAAAVAQADSDADGRAYADPRERELMQRITRSRAALERLRAGQADLPDLDTDGAERRLRLAEGALTWQLARAQPDRAWQAKKALRDAEAQVAEARARDAALVAAQQAEPGRQATFAKRIAELRTRLQALLPQIAALSSEQKQQLQATAVAELQAQQQRLVVYAAQAQLAIAQIQDSAQFARQGGAAAEVPR